MMKIQAVRYVLFLIVAAFHGFAMAQPKFSQPHGLYEDQTLTVAITPQDPDATITYTTDGREPTAYSTPYTDALTIGETTTLRAVEVKDGAVCSPITTASYIFIPSVLKPLASMLSCTPYCFIASKTLHFALFERVLTSVSS